MTPDRARVPHAPLPPSAWIVRHAHLVPAGARILDLACGFGRHSRYFAGRGVRVLAVDRDPEALATLEGVPGIETRRVDLEAAVWPLSDECFDAVVVTHYLYRPALPHVVAAVADDGALLYETFARGNEVYGRPSNPDFLLEPAELLDLARESLTVVAFDQGIVADDGRRAVMQRLAAVGRRRGWPPLVADIPLVRNA